MLHVDDLIEPRPEQILLPRLAPFPWPHRTLRSSPLSSRESRLEIRGNPPREFARKSTPNNQFPANPIAEIPAISIADQLLRNISRTTNAGGDRQRRRDQRPPEARHLPRPQRQREAGDTADQKHPAQKNGDGKARKRRHDHGCEPQNHEQDAFDQKGPPMRTYRDSHFGLQLG